MEITGKLKVKNEVQVVTQTFSKREFVIKTNEQYPQFISIELHADKVDLIDPYVIGEEIKVHINLRGREWISPQNESKYFNTIVAWRIERIVNSNTQEPQKPFTAAAEANSFVDVGEENETDPLPF